ncbi:MAG: DUF6359 domain-containing protein [Clostridium sp.]|nr:DUF6359 domain-containing protein [Prevotella sp.]MCM1428988.1 DUF6359 domain-containing protein [Clostridium sp.]
MKKSLLTLAAACFAVAGFAAETGTLENPLTVDQFISGFQADATVQNTYVQGYIVGYVNTGVSPNTYNFSISSTEAPLATNILIAGSSQEDQKDACIAVQLPSGSLRTALNLQAHPENLGHQVILCGTAQKYCGMPGIKETNSYQWVGAAPVAPEEKTLGSAAAPLTIPELKAISMIGVQHAYVKGYIVGAIPDGGMDLSATIFGTTGVAKTMITLAPSASTTNVAECIAVQLPAGEIRDAVNLADNPGNLGKELTVYGNYEAYFGGAGIKSVTQYVLGENGVIGGGDTPVQNGNIYEGLTATDTECDWTFENVVLPEGLTYVFSWKNYNNAYYLNASAYLGGTNYAATAIAYSPVIDLADYNDVTVSFEHAAKFQNNPNVKEEINFLAREEGGEWTNLEIPTWPEEKTWNFSNSGNISLKDFEGKKIQLGIRYTSSAEGADTWEFRNLVVKGVKASGVEAIEAADGEAVYFNLQGVRVANPENGLYIKVVNGKSQKVLVK